MEKVHVQAKLKLKFGWFLIERVDSHWADSKAATVTMSLSNFKFSRKNISVFES